MNQVQIGHTSLVMLQGRLRTIAADIRRIESEIGRTDDTREIRHQADEAIYEIDSWLIDPARQVRKEVGVTG